MAYEVMPAHTDEMLEPIRQLFAEFADGGGADLTSREFLLELIGLPGEFQPPRGRLYAAFEAGHLAGCGALRDEGDGVCEIRRVFVREEYRNSGVENRLLSKLLREAQDVGYSRAVLRPSESMAGLDELLDDAGFADDGEGTLSRDV